MPPIGPLWVDLPASASIVLRWTSPRPARARISATSFPKYTFSRDFGGHCRIMYAQTNSREGGHERHRCQGADTG